MWFSMAWFSMALTFLNINAQKNPVPVLFIAAVVCGLLWFLVVQARRREMRKAARPPKSDGWSGRSSRPRF